MFAAAFLVYVLLTMGIICPVCDLLRPSTRPRDWIRLNVRLLFGYLILTWFTMVVVSTSLPYYWLDSVCLLMR